MIQSEIDVPAPEGRAAFRSTHVDLGMAQLCAFGLSEDWLLRTCGDLHWQMIAQRAGQAGIALRDDAGRPVYAAFCATDLELKGAHGQLLGTRITISSTLNRMRGNRLGSTHIVKTPPGRTVARLYMITCFLRHNETGSNRRLLRSGLSGLDDLPCASGALLDVDRAARATAKEAHPRAPRCLSYAPTPALDFNAVGLLYFPTYSKIAGLAMPRTSPALRRSVTYLSNLDLGEVVHAEGQSGDLVLRAGDGRALAVIR